MQILATLCIDMILNEARLLTKPDHFFQYIHLLTNITYSCISIGKMSC
uniref:Uncharacterized protein n=1 Tax=Anguilla anguilla TaxID=7936 RepID=A0A0E9SEL0_ANGAN